MRFLFLTQYYPPEIGAAPTRLHSLAEQLHQFGHEVEIVTARPNYPRGRFFDGCGSRLYVRELRNGIVVHRVWIYPALGTGFGRLLNYTSFALMSLFALSRAQKPDFLFVESPPLTNSIPAFVSKLIRGVPYIFNVADLWPDAVLEAGVARNGLVHRLLLTLESWSYRQSSYVNAVTQGIGEALVLDKRVPSGKVLFLPNGVDADRFKPSEPDLLLKRELGLEGKRIILWAGTLGLSHGLEYVLQAAKILETDPGIHFLFLGDGSCRTQLQDLKQKLNLGNVTFHGPVSLELLPRYFSIADSSLVSLRRLPSHEAARPSKILPALGSGKPLIFVGAGEGARFVEQAQAGIVVPPENPELLADEIRRLFADSELLCRLGENGRRYIEDHMQWSTLVTRWLEHLGPSSGPIIEDVSISAAS